MILPSTICAVPFWGSVILDIDKMSPSTSFAPAKTSIVTLLSSSVDALIIVATGTLLNLFIDNEKLVDASY